MAAPNDYVSPPRKAPMENPVTKPADPGRAQTSIEFYEGAACRGGGLGKTLIRVQASTPRCTKKPTFSAALTTALRWVHVQGEKSGEAAWENEKNILE